MTTRAVEAKHGGVWLRWSAATVAGEVVGLGGAGVLAAIARMVVPAEVPASVQVVLFALMLAAGAGEGAVVGLAQSRVLVRALPSVPRGRWIASTTAGALLAWAAGAALFMSLPDDAAFEAYAWLLVPLAWVLGGVLGACQWVALRGHVRGAGWWIAANAAGWGLGLLVSFAVPMAITESTPTAVVALLAVLTGAGTGLSPGVVTGYAMARYAEQRVRV